MEFGLIGEKLSHSHSPPIHRLLGDYDYSLVELTPAQLCTFMTKRDFRAVNVTIPYKKEVLPYLSGLSPEAQAIGSVNTVVNRNGELFGYNTDYDGFLFAARFAGISFADKKVMVLGTGGTSLAVQAAARDKGARDVVVVSRNGTVNYDNLYEQGDIELLINTTPVGMYPNNGDAVVSLSRFQTLSGVMDVIYNPLSTNLLLQAKRMGIPRANGLMMLVAQARRASELFLDRAVKDEKVIQITSVMSKNLSNIVLVGMPGSGKTSIGRAVAKELCREFIDTDRLIEQKTGLSIPEIFERFGEDFFRRLEREVVSQAGKLTGIVISAGGGCVLFEENSRALMQNGVLFFIERELRLLETYGRPLSTDLSALTGMYDRRLPLYLSVSDIVIGNSSELADAATRVISAFDSWFEGENI